MQTKHEALVRQQQILKALGYYSGKIDGIWGPASIKAMQKFESLPEFLPGHPHNGMPFHDSGPYPAGIVMKDDGLLHHPALDKKVEVKETEPVHTSAVQAQPQQHDKRNQNQNSKA